MVVKKGVQRAAHLAYLKDVEQAGKTEGVLVVQRVVSTVCLKGVLKAA